MKCVLNNILVVSRINLIKLKKKVLFNLIEFFESTNIFNTFLNTKILNIAIFKSYFLIYLKISVVTHL